MIASFRSKVLKRFAVMGDASKLPVANVRRIERILRLLDAADIPEGMNIAGLRFDGLQGQPKRYAVDASANDRITFGWSGDDAIDVDIEDYH